VTLPFGRLDRIKSVWTHWKKFDASIINGDTVLNQDFREFIQSLNSNQVRYLVVGGYAVAFHGHPRYTKDLDVWVEPNPANALNVVKALDEFGFGSLGLKEADFLTPDQIVQLGNPPNRIELFTTIPGVDFNSCYTVRVESEIDGVNVNFIDIENLKNNKKASGRLQDLADVESLE
jgi:hypothetical protein